MKKWLPIILIVALMVTAYFLGLFDALSFESLRMHHMKIKTFVAESPIIAPLIYIAAYIIITALSIPGALFVTIAGGYLFPMPFSVLYTVIGATIGATILFSAAKTAIGDLLKKKAGSLVQKMEVGFREGEVSYLLFLRLVPLFPFWLINLAPAFFGVRLWTFVWTTFVGIIPGSYVFCQAGRGLDAILDSGGTLTAGKIFNTQIIIALVVLALFSLIPIIVKKIRKRKKP
jgi:uncharacterized membrane protein YdjX (TVP38/TMEM64 family)